MAFAAMALFSVMKNPYIPISIMLLLFLALLFSSCDKSEENVNPDDPSNLVITILSTNHETGFVEIQASALNTVLYHLYIEENEEPEVVNETGFFEYSFSGEGNYTITVRAYGKSGRYLKRSAIVTISPGGQTPEVPLDKGYFSPESYDGYILIWQDEFNGSSLNTDYWTHEIGSGGWGNNELQYYRSENTSMNGGTLIIEARDDGYGGSDYTSSRMVTRNKFDFQYGRVDIRALLPRGQGLWPALWMLGQNFGSV
ncbi:MAG TPA: glycoside hydrolase family 16 protein, partial [Bacteroidales bacterium]|nr:glycoside hydrolase family 16 protein [Bacteroidales bacterium]